MPFVGGGGGGGGVFGGMPAGAEDTVDVTRIRAMSFIKERMFQVQKCLYDYDRKDPSRSRCNMCANETSGAEAKSTSWPYTRKSTLCAHKPVPWTLEKKQMLSRLGEELRNPEGQ
jgi:hypothetical protein